MKHTQLTYRIVHFTKANKFVGIAWNYDEAIIATTAPKATYTEAREALSWHEPQLNAVLQWFDGSYRCEGNGDFMVPTTVEQEQEAQARR